MTDATQSIEPTSVPPASPTSAQPRRTEHETRDNGRTSQNVPASQESFPSGAGVSGESEPVSAARSGRKPGMVRRLLGAVPTLLVFSALAGVGYWGHHTGWKLPTFSELTGTAEAAKPGWCDAHGVPEAQCVECRAELLPAGEYYGWCGEHGVPQCPLCHPDVAQLKETPDVEPADQQRAKRALALKERPENNPLCLLHKRRIQFASREAVEKAGVDVDVVIRRPIVEAIDAVGEVVYDQTRVARLSSRSPGTVWRVEKEVGDRVQAGEVLALVDAAQVGRAKSELLAALADWDLRQKDLARVRQVAGGAVAQRVVQEAESAESAAGIRVRQAVQALVNLGLSISYGHVGQSPRDELMRELQFLGLPQEITGALDPERTTSNLLPVTSPAAGVVVEREVVAGEVVDPAKMLFTVVDISRVWLMFDIPVEDAKYLAVGQPVRFRPDGRRDAVMGKVAWISTSVEVQTRTVSVRADVPNSDGRLRHETFGTGQILLREEPEAIVVPHESVAWDGSCHVVFVRDRDYFDSEEGPKVFHTRTVRVGAKTDDYTEIIAGVLPGEVIATAGSGVLRGELLKNNLGAG